jgi:LuxR family maltose regulon positive regulatory protein
LAARRRLWAGDAQAAAALLQPWLDGGADVDMISSSADLRLTLAAAQLACGRVGPAWQALRPALALVRESGEIMPLQLAGERLLAPLIAADWRGVAAEPELIALLPQLRPAAASVPITAAVQRGDSRSHELSARERQIVERIAAGDSNKLIARAFDLSPHTVKRHVANILDKLGMSSRGQVAAWYHAH